MSKRLRAFGQEHRSLSKTARMQEKDPKKTIGGSVKGLNTERNYLRGN